MLLKINMKQKVKKKRGGVVIKCHERLWHIKNSGSGGSICNRLIWFIIHYMHIILYTKNVKIKFL